MPKGKTSNDKTKTDLSKLERTAKRLTAPPNSPTGRQAKAKNNQTDEEFTHAVILEDLEWLQSIAKDSPTSKTRKN